MYLPPYTYLRPRSQSYAATECLFHRIFSVGPSWTSLSKKTTTELVVFPSLLDLPRSQHAPNTFPHLRASSIVAAMGCWQPMLCTTSALWLVALPVGLVTAGGAAGVTVGRFLTAQVGAPRGANSSTSFSYSDRFSYGDQSFITISSATDADVVRAVPPFLSPCSSFPNLPVLPRLRTLPL